MSTKLVLYGRALLQGDSADKTRTEREREPPFVWPSCSFLNIGLKALLGNMAKCIKFRPVEILASIELYRVGATYIPNSH